LLKKKTRTDYTFTNTQRKCDGEFYPIIDKIISNYNLDSWLGLTDRERRAEIEKYVSY